MLLVVKQEEICKRLQKLVVYSHNVIQQLRQKFTASQFQILTTTPTKHAQIFPTKSERPMLGIKLGYMGKNYL